MDDSRSLEFVEECERVERKRQKAERHADYFEPAPVERVQHIAPFTEADFREWEHEADEAIARMERREESL